MSTLSDTTTGIIIKSDRTGRTRYPQTYKQEVLAAFESSSLSAPDFAEQCGIKYSTFAAWVAREKRHANTPASEDSPTFLIAEMTPEPSGPALEVRLTSGAIARVANTRQIHLLAELLRQLA